MKQKQAVLFLLALTLSICTACGSPTSTKDGITTNKTFRTDKMYTVGGEEVAIQGNPSILGSEEIGLAFALPQVWEPAQNNLNFTVPSRYELYADFVPDAVRESIQSFDAEAASEEERTAFLTEAYGNLYHFMCLYRVNASEEDSARLGEEVARQYENHVELAQNGKDTYFVAYNSTIPENTYSEQEVAALNALISGIDALKQNLILFPPLTSASESSFSGNLNVFSTTDLDGNPVTQDVFKDYDLTMVNVWMTWCGPCVQEMPELQELYGQLPDNVNLISICGDAVSEPDTARAVLTSAKATFPALQTNEALEEQFMQYITAYPSTVFVDRTGTVVGVQVGAPGRQGSIVDGYLKLIQDNLNKLSDSGTLG